MNGQLDGHFGICRTSPLQVCAKSFLVKPRHHFNDTSSCGTVSSRQVVDDSSWGRVRSCRHQYPLGYFVLHGSVTQYIQDSVCFRICRPLQAEAGCTILRYTSTSLHLNSRHTYGADVSVICSQQSCSVSDLLSNKILTMSVSTQCTLKRFNRNKCISTVLWFRFRFRIVYSTLFAK